MEKQFAQQRVAHPRRPVENPSPDAQDDGEFEHYDLTADPAESNNLAARHPDMVKKRSAKLEAWVAKLPKEYLKTKDKDD